MPVMPMNVPPSKLKFSTVASKVSVSLILPPCSMLRLSARPGKSTESTVIRPACTVIFAFSAVTAEKLSLSVNRPITENGT